MYGIFRSLLPQLMIAVSLVLAGMPGVLDAADLQAGWSAQAQSVNARFDAQWKEIRSAFRLEHGWLFARNDGEHLYLLIDLPGDTVEDRPLSNSPWGDTVSLAFDVDRNHEISVGRDFKLAQFRGGFRLGRQVFVGPGRFSGLGPTGARLAAGFAPSPISARPHRIWEFSIPLEEIAAVPDGSVLLGVEIRSVHPSFLEEYPSNHTRRMQRLIEIKLAANPASIKFTKLSPGALRKLAAGQRIIVRPDTQALRPGPKMAAPGQSEPCPLPEGEPIKRAILEDGTIELSYANGSKKLNFQGGWKILCPDGTPVPTMVLRSTQIPPTLPPELPDEIELRWLDYHSLQLLGVIRALVNDDPMVDAYLDTEGADWSPFQRIQSRSETISYLLAE